MTKVKSTLSFKKIMSHPLSIILGVAIGTYIGIYHEKLGKSLAPWGNLYLSALQMTIIPYIVVTISSSIAKMLGDSEAKIYMRKIAIVFISLLFVTSAIGLLGGIILKPGNMDVSEMKGVMQVGSFSASRIITADEPIEKDQSKGLISFVTDSLPSNIFKAFAEGQILQIVFFTLLFGVAMGFSGEGLKSTAFPMLDTLRETFMLMIKAIVLILPIGVALIFADQISNLSVDVFMAMLKFLFTNFIVMLGVFLIASIIIWRKSNTTYWGSISAFSDTMFVALSTRNSLVTMPTAITELIDNLKFDRRIVNLVVPIGIATCRYGNVLYFAFGAVFVAQLYSTPLTFPDYIIILVGSVLAGLTTSGASGIVTLPMMSLILDPLGLPLGAVLILFYAVDPIIDPFRSLIIVYVNCAATALIAEQRPDQGTVEEEFEALTQQEIMPHVSKKTGKSKA